jgi:hypothetical protein
LSGAADPLSDVRHRYQLVSDGEGFKSEFDQLGDGIQHGVEKGARGALG